MTRRCRRCVVFLLLLAFFSLIVPIFSPYPFDKITSDIHQAPSALHWLGTDNVGRDVFTRLALATRISLLIGLATAFFAGMIGTILGMWGSYRSGLVDRIVARVAEIFLAFPDVMFVLFMMSVIGSGLFKLIGVLVLMSWPHTTKVVRGVTKSVREEGYIQYAKQARYPEHIIVLRHIFPNVLPALSVCLVNQVGLAILSEAALSFLGMGVSEPMPSWGNMLSEAKSLTVLLSAPWVWIPPTILLFLTLYHIYIVGIDLTDHYLTQ